MRCALACYVAIAALLACAPPLLAEERNNSTPPFAVVEPPSAAAALVISIGKAPPSLGSTEEVSAASVTSSSPVTLVLKADLGTQRLTVLEGGTVLHVWPISSGLRDYPTPTGTFQPKSANRMWYSRQYDWTPMPYAVFFTRGVAFHGTSATWRLGKSASHGCVRLATSDAAKLFALVHTHGFAQTRIIVYGTPKHDAPLVAHRGSSETTASNRLPSWAEAAFNR